MKLAAIILFLIPVVVARHNHRTLLETILKSKGNLYRKVDDNVENVMNNLFNELNLAPNFLARSRIKLLLTMHYDLKSIAENNFEEYEKMVEAAKIDRNTNKRIGLYELIEKTLHDKSLNQPVSSKNQTSRKHTKHKTTEVQRTVTVTPTLSLKNDSQDDSVFGDSEEFQTFIKDFIKKVDNLSVADFTKAANAPSSDEKYSNEPDLDVWQPPSILELDFVNDTSTRRIFRGKRSKIKSYPFIVSIHLMGTFTCAGSILSRDIVISAASCLQLLYNNRFYRENPRSLFVRIGSDYYSRGGEMIPVIETYFHPGYDPKTLENNLVLMRMQRRIRFLRRETRVKRVMYDDVAETLPFNTEGIIVAGWGPRRRNNVLDQSERLLVAQLDIYHAQECSHIYSRKFVTNRHFCAGFVSKGGGACNKDLGGPGIVAGILVGVISFGAPGCGAIDSPTVFTKLGFYKQWIDDVVYQADTITIAVGTTLARGRKKKPFYPQVSYGLPKLITPVVRSHEDLREGAVENEDLRLITPATISNNALRDILYDDYSDVTKDDVFDMFKTTTKIDPMQHPLANLSLVPLPVILSSTDTTAEYVTITLTTAPTLLPLPPELTVAVPTLTEEPIYYTEITETTTPTTTDFVDLVSIMEKEKHLAPIQRTNYDLYGTTTAITASGNNHHMKHQDREIQSHHENHERQQERSHHKKLKKHYVVRADISQHKRHNSGSDRNHHNHHKTRPKSPESDSPTDFSSDREYYVDENNLGH